MQIRISGIRLVTDTGMASYNHVLPLSDIVSCADYNIMFTECEIVSCAANRLEHQMILDLMIWFVGNVGD